MKENQIKLCSETVVNLQKVQEVKQYMPPHGEIFSLAETFKILGDPTRLKIVLALAKDELCVCDLATLFELSVSAISHQLRLLRGMKLVKYRKAGKMVYYSLDDEHIEDIIRLAQTHVREIPRNNNKSPMKTIS
jgi:DNA-binding transcriptional ArsR family regulator